ncbi:RidA family protein [Methanocorpusculum sp.]|nr:RidA family protein [Methanocorpusculum sp.]
MKQIHTDRAPAALGPYSQAVVSGGLCFTSGQIALSPETGEIVGEDITTQTRQVLENLCAVLAAAGASTEKVLKTTCYLADIADFAAFNAVYAEYFPGKPARSCVAVKDLPRGALVEVEAVAEVL